MKRILQVEDLNEYSDAFIAQAKSRNWNVYLAEDFSMAKVMLTRYKYDAIVLDVNFPVGGIDLTTKLSYNCWGFYMAKEIKKNHNIPVVMFTDDEEKIGELRGIGIYYPWVDKLDREKSVHRDFDILAKEVCLELEKVFSKNATRS
jgi:DNA-binding response OmpR family regulator